MTFICCIYVYILVLNLVLAYNMYAKISYKYVYTFNIHFIYCRFYRSCLRDFRKCQHPASQDMFGGDKAPLPRVPGTGKGGPVVGTNCSFRARCQELKDGKSPSTADAFIQVAYEFFEAGREAWRVKGWAMKEAVSPVVLPEDQ